LVAFFRCNPAWSSWTKNDEKAEVEEFSISTEMWKVIGETKNFGKSGGL